MSFFSENLPKVQARIEAALLRSNRPPGSVTLIAVTKTHPPETVREALAAGLDQIGENKVQEARAKKPEAGDRGVWHLIGHLQTNKVKYVPPLFAELRETRDRVEKETGLALPELSMGMSHDFEVAIEEGATMVRLGTVLFGPRPKAVKASPSDTGAE